MTRSNKSVPGSSSRIAGGKNDEKEDQKIFRATSANVKSLSDNINVLSTSFKGLNKEVRISRATFYSLNKTMRSASISPAGGTNAGMGGNVLGSIAQGGRSMMSTMGQWASNLVEYGKTVSFSNLSLAMFTARLGLLKGPLDGMVKDIIKLNSMGQGYQSLAGLYVDAGLAGMSLRDYTSVLQDSQALLARSSNFDEFNKKLKYGTDELAKIGIFGDTATKLSATMAESATELGVPQSQLVNSTSGLLSVFAPLQGAMRLTAEGFTALIKNLEDSEEVQQNMLGLSASERASRMKDLIQMQTFGLQMGASASASKKLADAFMAQRSTLFSQRFEGAGRVGQAGAYLGMNSQDIATLSRLSLKKNLTAEDMSTMQPILAQMDKEFQQRMNSGDQATVFAAEQQFEALPDQIKQMMKASGTVALTAEEKSRTAFAHASSTLEVAAGKLLQWAEGMSKSPLGQLASGLLGNVIGSMIGSGLLKGVIGKMLGKVPGMGGVTEVVKDFGGGLVKIFKSVFGGLLSGAKMLGWLSALIDPIAEMFTGTISAAFSPDGDILSRLGNAIFSGFTGLITGITGLIDNVFGTNITNFMEKGFTLIRVLGQRALKNLIDWMIDILPASAIPDWATDMSKSLGEAIDNSDKVLNQLAADSSATLSSIGEANKKAGEATVKDAKKNNADVQTLNAQTNDIVYGTDGLAAKVLDTARTIQGMPGQSPVTMVTQPEVNTAVQTAAAATQVISTGTQVMANQPDLATLMTQLISLMQQMLMAENTQVDQLGQLVRTTTKTSFGSNESAVMKVFGANS